MTMTVDRAALTDTPDPVALGHYLDAHYTLEALRALCLSQSVDFDNLPGETKAVKARGLVAYYQRRAMLDRLAAIVLAPIPPCPYPGMVPFTAEQAPFFYGRAAETQWLLDRLEVQRALYVIGPSASGKSSLVAAGLLPALTNSKVYPLGAWAVRVMRPGAQPLAELTRALGGVPAPTAVAACLVAAPPATCLLLVVDQLEELFAQASRAQQGEFVAALKTLMANPVCTVLLTLRADFYPHLMTSDLWPVSPAQRLEIAPLRGAALHDAVQQPASDVGVYVEPALTERLLADAADEPGVLPLLQETMRWLWRRMADRRLTLETYQTMGKDGQSGLAVAVTTRADAAIDSLTSTQQTIARRVLLDLVQLGETGPDTRRRQPLVDLSRPADAADDFQAVVKALTDHRLIIESAANEGREATVDLAHEVLISGWPRLRGWLAEDRAALLIHRELSAATHEWRAHTKDDSYVYIGARLQDAARFATTHPADISADEAAFLAASERQDARRIRARYLGQAAGAAVGSAVGYGIGYGLALAASPRIALSDPQIIILLALLVFPLGMLVGGVLGAPLWLQRDHRTRRVALATALAGVVGGLPLAVVVWATQPAATQGGAAVLAGLVGGLLAAGMGFGAGWTDRRGRRLLGTVLGGLVGALLAAGSSALPGMPEGLLSVWGELLLGATVGLMTGLGLYVTAVDRNVHTRV